MSVRAWLVTNRNNRNAMLVQYDPDINNRRRMKRLGMLTVDAASELLGTEPSKGELFEVDVELTKVTELDAGRKSAFRIITETETERIKAAEAAAAAAAPADAAAEAPGQAKKDEATT